MSKLKFLRAGALASVVALWILVGLLIASEVDKPLATIGSALEAIGISALMAASGVASLVVIDWVTKGE